MRTVKAQLMGMVSGKSEKPADSTYLPDSATLCDQKFLPRSRLARSLLSPPLARCWPSIHTGINISSRAHWARRGWNTISELASHVSQPERSGSISSEISPRPRFLSRTSPPTFCNSFGRMVALLRKGDEQQLSPNTRG